ncbi:MAG: hypothetical protein JJV97_02255 [SAR324 cluster bacterium]|nr:hypothetical protein [SAR324 cluster bacterium]
MRVKLLYSIVITLALFAIGVWVYANFYSDTASSYYDLFYRVTNLVLLGLIVVIFTGDKIPKALNALLQGRRKSFVDSEVNLKETNAELTELEGGKVELKNELAQKQEVALKLVEGQGKHIIDRAIGQTERIELEKDTLLKKMQRDSILAVKLAIFDEATQKFCAKYKSRGKEVEAENFEMIFKGLK